MSVLYDLCTRLLFRSIKPREGNCNPEKVTATHNRDYHSTSANEMLPPNDQGASRCALSGV